MAPDARSLDDNRVDLLTVRRAATAQPGELVRLDLVVHHFTEALCPRGGARATGGMSSALPTAPAVRGTFAAAPAEHPAESAPKTPVCALVRARARVSATAPVGAECAAEEAHKAAGIAAAPGPVPAVAGAGATGMSVGSALAAVLAEAGAERHAIAFAPAEILSITRPLTLGVAVPDAAVTAQLQILADHVGGPLVCLKVAIGMKDFRLEVAEQAVDGMLGAGAADIVVETGKVLG